jgi:alkylated DNA repair dioxygenase AlkB
MATSVWQPSLLGADAAPDALRFDGAVRHDLGSGAWVEEVPFCASGTDELFDLVFDAAPWGGVEHRPMYDRIVEVPRLYSGVWSDPPEVLVAMADQLSQRYTADLCSISANLYRDGSDSVAWHGDRVGRHRAITTVAILTLGSPRRFLLRPSGGGPSRVFEPGSGDLLVMGGTCQRTFEHSVPKRAHAGPRICVMFREPGGN